MKRVFKIITMLILFLKAIYCFGQENSTEPVGIYEFVIITDPEDSFVNLRNTPNIKGSIDKQLQNGKVMFAYEQDGNWILVERSKAEGLKNDIATSGYVHKSRVKKISSLKEVKNTSSTNNSISFTSENIFVQITQRNFVKSEHKCFYSDDEYYHYDKGIYNLELIDGKEPWGTDGNIPRMEYKNITIKIDGKTITLPEQSYKNLYEPNLSNTSVHYDTAKDTLYIIANNSDGAGAYATVLIIENKKYKERVLEIPF
ncbi:hypothetical protein [Flavobacterium litorale]|uniref:SH3 domain-containing protein n=1 Tax=Flavobacterium litorale TaxID=2856519 RepID=A0ABX8VD98_9FLAO|nr:hypothetical protein [Flavobacterium litorale]QYJ69133.1 hypothetical protein K1I41_04380 [Flavobacterium litorale]